MANETVVGIVVLARHGDRLGFYQDPTTYVASSTSTTPLGEAQELALGSLLRTEYLSPASPLFISGIDDQINTAQVKVRADAGDEGGVIFDSSVALLQGLFPPSKVQNTTLANGTTVVSPLGGYQYVPIESVESAEDVSLEGHASCTAWNNRVTQIYNSTAFIQMATQAASFLGELSPFVGDRTVTLSNMYNIFDFMNVQSIHNSTFLKDLPPSFLAQAQDLANFHEWILFSDSASNGIGNIDAYTILPSILGALQDISNISKPLKLHYSAISYKPFISLFNLTSTANESYANGGVVNYASAMVLEVVNTTGSDVLGLRMKFKNGTADSDFKTIALPSGMSDVNSFVQSLQPFAINNTLSWCNACNNHVDRGCAAYFSSSNSSVVSRGPAVSNVAAGFIGAGVALAVVLASLVLMSLVGLVGFGVGRSKGRKGIQY